MGSKGSAWRGEQLTEGHACWELGAAVGAVLAGVVARKGRVLLAQRSDEPSLIAFGVEPGSDTLAGAHGAVADARDNGEDGSGVSTTRSKPAAIRTRTDSSSIICRWSPIAQPKYFNGESV